MKGRRAGKDFFRPERKIILWEDKHIYCLVSSRILAASLNSKSKPADGLFHFQRKAGEEGDTERVVAEA